MSLNLIIFDRGLLFTLGVGQWPYLVGECVSKNKKQGSYLGGGSANYNITLQGTLDGWSCNRPEPGSHPVIPDYEFQGRLNNRSSTSVMQNILCTSLTDPLWNMLTSYSGLSNYRDASCMLPSRALEYTYLRGLVWEPPLHSKLYGIIPRLFFTCLHGPVFLILVSWTSQCLDWYWSMLEYRL